MRRRGKQKICRDIRRRPNKANPTAKKVTVQVTRKQHQRHQKRANKKGMNLTDYMRQQMLNGKIEVERYAFFKEAADQIAESEAELARIEQRIKTEQRYSPDDIVQIERITDFIIEASLKVMEKMR